MHELKAGTLAYFDSFSGMVPVKIVSIWRGDAHCWPFDDRLQATFVVMATRGAYRRGAIVHFPVTRDVLPRAAVHTVGGTYGQRISVEPFTVIPDSVLR